MLHRIWHTLWASPGTTIGAGATLTSPTIDLRLIDQIEGLQLRVSSVVGTADCRVEFQTSWDDVNWDEEDDNPDITASTLLAKPGNPEGWNTYPVPSALARYMRILIDEISAGALADTLVEAKLTCRERLG